MGLMEAKALLGKVYEEGGWLIAGEGTIGFPKSLDPDLTAAVIKHKDDLLPLLKWDWDEQKQIWQDANDYVTKIFREIGYQYNGYKIGPYENWHVDLFIECQNAPAKLRAIQAAEDKDMGAYRAAIRSWVTSWVLLKKDIEAKQREAC